MKIVDHGDARTPDLLRSIRDRIDSWLASPPEGASAFAGPDAIAEALESVRRDGDSALAKLQETCSGRPAKPDAIRIAPEAIAAARENAPEELLRSLERAATQVRRFHENARPSPIATYRFLGSRIRTDARPLDRAGVIVADRGRRALSTLMGAAIPAQVAGVDHVALALPPDETGQPANELLALAAHLEIEEVWALDALPALAAFAYGTESILPVDVVTGTGGLDVLAARRWIDRRVADRIAGPSELVVLADAGASPEWIAADLVAEAESSALAAAVAVTENADFADAIGRAVTEQLRTVDDAERDRVGRTLDQHGAIVVTPDLDTSIAVAEELAPRAVEILRADADDVMTQIKRAGAVFLGPHTPAAIGGLCAGPSPMLPGGGTARFASGLSIRDFHRETLQVEFTEEGYRWLSGAARALATADHLPAHERSLALRES